MNKCELDCCVPPVSADCFMLVSYNDHPIDILYNVCSFCADDVINASSLDTYRFISEEEAKIYRIIEE
jgi:hypothetical protein